MTLESPLVSVIMPVFNAERFLRQAVDSIIHQQYQDFEFLIIDDGSTDGSGDILRDYLRQDKRIRLFQQPVNQGLITALNIGLSTAQGKYIARMDADDISLPDRFSRQVEYLEAHPEVGVLGSKIRYIDETDTLGLIPVSFHGDVSIRWHALFESPFFHPVVMFRKELVDRYNFRYDPHTLHSEDYDLWRRFLLKTKGENLKDILLYYRIHPESLSVQNAVFLNITASLISSEAIYCLLPDLGVSKEDILHLSNSIHGITREEKRQRARLNHLYLLTWNEFRRLFQCEPGINELGREVIAWAARMILYPPLQTGALSALWQLTKVEWRWPYYLFTTLPYFIKRRL